MNLSNWKPYFKLDKQGIRCTAQNTYEPLISPDGKTFCKNYDHTNLYQRNNPLYTKEIVDWFFNNEIKYLTLFKDKLYSPKITDIDYKNKKIFIKWYKKNCNEIIYSNEYWPVEDWKLKIKNIIIDQFNSGIYKLTMYPHCHYIDDDNNMRTIDWYGCVDRNDPYVDSLYIDSIISEPSKHRLDETGEKNCGRYNLEIMFKRGLFTHVNWGNESLNFIYKEIFND